MPGSTSRPGSTATSSIPQITWVYETEPLEALGGRRMQWPRGKVLGGSSSINGLIYIRGQKQDFDHWRQLGNAGWSYDDVLPYFRRAEGQERGSDDFHGGEGPLAVTDMRGGARAARRLHRRPARRPATSSTPTSTAPSRKASAPISSPCAAGAAPAPPSPICARR